MRGTSMKAMFAVLLAMQLVACGGGGGGGSGGNAGSQGSGSGTGSAPGAANATPSATILAAGVNITTTSVPNADLSATTNSPISLSGSSSSDGDGDILSFKWRIDSKPAGSNLNLANDGLAQIDLTPDVLGVYTIALRVTDARGASAEKKLVIDVNNRAPTSSVSAVVVTFSPITVTKPTQVISGGDKVLFDGSTSTDPDGDPVTLSYQLTEKPGGSTASIGTGANATAWFTADLSGTYKVKARGVDPYGASHETVYVFNATNRAPTTVLLTTVTPAGQNQGSATAVVTSVGYIVNLSGASSTDPEGQSLTYSWALNAKPAGSTVVLSNATAASVQFEPDLLGTYSLRLTTTDAQGASSYRDILVSANNRRPLANITSNATPVAIVSAPTIRLPVGTILTLRGNSSIDADGDALVYAWSLISAPAGSTAALSASSGPAVTFTPDVNGAYVLQLRATDPAGAYSERSVTIESGNHAPVAVVNRDRMTVLLGASVSASAALSFDEDIADTLSYAWSVDARPAGSAAQLTNPTSASPGFTPDAAGTYVLSATVSDGRNASIAYVTVRAMSSLSGSVALPFAPLSSKYSRGLDKLVIASTGPDTLRIVDPFNGGIQTVALPVGVTSFQLSADGKLAAVLHNSLMSLVDLQTATVVKTFATGGQHTDAFITNAGTAYLIGQMGAQWVDQPIRIMNARTGSLIGTASVRGTFYGTQTGIFADRRNKVFYMPSGLSPSDINYFTLNPQTGAVVDGGDSPYHGSYSMGTPLFLDEDQSYLFTPYGTYFSTDTLSYAGTLGNDQFLSLTQHGASQELLALSYTSGYYVATQYSASYKRFTGPLMLPDSTLPFPLVGGLQSYGLGIFHSANAHHVALVQTGSNQANGPGVQYHVIYR